jgi:hypothetical protein
MFGMVAYAEIIVPAPFTFLSGGWEYFCSHLFGTLGLLESDGGHNEDRFQVLFIMM